MLMKNEFNISELKAKLDYEEYYQLEKHILDYSSKNDEILFEAGFCYAWSLFCDCMREQEYRNK